jgi:hypothetical protein
LRFIITACRYVKEKRVKVGLRKFNDGESLHPDNLKLEKEYYKLSYFRLRKTVNVRLRKKGRRTELMNRRLGYEVEARLR